MPEITLRAEEDSVRKAIDFLREHIGEKHADVFRHVELAVEELVINIALYAYGEGGSAKNTNLGKFELSCRWVNMDGQDLFCVRFRDWGRPFDPFRDAQIPDTSSSVEKRKVGGLGIHIVKHISNHYVYSGADGSNTVELYFTSDDTKQNT